MHKDGLFSAFVLIALGILVIMVLHEWDSDTGNEDGKVIESPAIILESFAADVFDDNGLLQYHISADKLLQYDHINETVVQSPRLELRDPELVWDINAARGKVTENGRRIHLSDGVVAQRHQGEEILLKTAELYYQPSREILEIPVPVSIEHQLGSTRAGRLTANIKQGILELSDHVESIYKPGLQ